MSSILTPPAARPAWMRVCTLACLGLPLVACSGSGGSSSSGYSVQALVSDGSVNAAHTDAQLVNAWGLVFAPDDYVWIANNGSNSSTLYDGSGVAQSLVVAVPDGSNGPAKPTGIVYNGGADFVVSSGGNSAAALFIYAGEGGTLAGWSPSVDATNAITVYDDGAGGAIYKGLALASSGGASYLYAADFHNAKIDVFDAVFALTALAGSFQDPALPAGYAPFGIQAVGSQLVVTYAEQDAAAEDEVDGAGLGYVDLYNTDGTLARRLVSGGVLNAPWGVAQAPDGFGPFSGALLVANFGDGRINAFDPATGMALGTLASAAGTPLQIDGLWGIAFGNGFAGQSANTLYFTAGPGDEAGGLYGSIAYASSTMSGGGGIY